MIITMVASSLLLIISALAAQQARLSYLIAQRMRESAETSVAAETVLASAIADTLADARFERFDQHIGSPFPFAAGTPRGPLPDGFTVETTINTIDPKSIDIVARATGSNYASRTLTTTIRRTGMPFIPATLYSASGSTSFISSGTTRIVGDRSSNTTTPAIGAPTAAAAAQTYQNVVAAGSLVEGHQPSGASRWSNLGDALDRIRAAPNNDLPDTVTGGLAPGLWHAKGSIEVGSAHATGIWLVEGDLVVRNSLEMAGILFLLGDLHVDPEAQVEIEGAVIMGRPGSSIISRGGFSIAHHLGALQEADRINPGVLEHRAVAIGWRDVS